MKKKKSAVDVVVAIVTALLLLGIIAGGIAIVYRYVRGSADDVSAFSVEYGDTKIVSGSTQLYLAPGQKHTFTVKYPKTAGEEQSNDFSVRIMASSAADFSFIVGEDGEERLFWTDCGDITSAFTLEKEDTSFSITIPDGYCARKVLEALYAGQAVEAPDDSELSTVYLYTLEVTDIGSGETCSCLFSLNEGLWLSPDRLYM